MAFAKPRDGIRRLVCGFPSRFRRDRCIVILNGYFDESGSTSGDVYVLAGFFSTAENWELFSDEWQAICERDPKTPDFKMREAIRLKEYEWTERQRDSRIMDLVNLITKRAMYRIDAVTYHADYDRVVRGRIPQDLDKPYFILFLNVIVAMCEYMANLEMVGTLDIVFDKQEDLVEEQCVHWYHWIKRNVASEIASRLGSTPNFRHDSDVLPLKAADLLAWQIRRHLNMEQPLGQGVNEALDSLLSMYGVSCNVRPKELASLVDSIQNKMAPQTNAQFLYPPKRTVRGVELGAALRQEDQI